VAKEIATCSSERPQYTAVYKANMYHSIKTITVDLHLLLTASIHSTNGLEPIELEQPA
jgi:succinate dehydrogenase hydrophobic anchor subunit